MLRCQRHMIHVFMLIFLLGTNYYLPGQTFQPVKHITTADGLPSNIITSILADDDGFIWVATNNGFCRWDGFSTLVYQNQVSDSNSLIDNAIPRNGFIKDEQGNLFIGTSKGLSIFNLASSRFTNFYTDPNNSSGLSSGINVVYNDSKGNIWVGTDDGFCKFNQTNNTFQPYQYTQKFPENVLLDQHGANKIHDIREDPHDQSILWLASLSGLLKFNKKTETFSWFYYNDSKYLRELNQFNMLVSHPDHLLFIGTWNYDMLAFNTRTGSFTGRYGEGAARYNFIQERVTPYAVNQNGKLWISSLAGLGTFDPSNQKFDLLQTFENKNGHRQQVELFLQDQQNHLWLGSENGIYVVKTENGPIENYFFNPTDENHWYLTRDLFEDIQNNQLIIGFGRGDGLHFFDLQNKTFSFLSFEQPGINEFNISSILREPDGNILFSTIAQIYRYYPEQNRVVQTSQNFSQFPVITDMQADAEGNIWLATANLGLINFDPQTGLSLEIEKTNQGNKHFGLPMIQQISIDPQGKIWFSRRGQSYGFYNPENDSVYLKNDSTGLQLNITCLGEYSGDTLWIATAGRGLGFINTRFPQQGFQPFFTMADLPQTFISDIITGVKNELWCLSRAGILRLNVKTKQVHLIDENNGLIIHDDWSDKNALIPGKLKLLSNGKIAVGYRRGLGFIDPENLTIPIALPQPYINSLRVFDEEFSLKNHNSSIRLAHDQNYISINYSAHDLYHSGFTLHHMMEGVDKEWQKQQAGEDVVYPNLSPGKYLLRLQTSTISGFGKPNEVTLILHITPPWWKSVWAILLFFILGIGLIIVVYKSQLKRQLEKREARRLRELDELKTKLYTNITHEFRTPLTVILGLAEDLAGNEYNKEAFQNKLHSIQRNGSNLLHLVNQMLDLAKLEHGKLTYSPIRGNIIAWAQYLVESHQSLAESKGVQLTFYPETAFLEMDYDPDQLSKVISNLLTNAIKFTPATGKVIFHIKHDSQNEQLIIKVKDDGIGIPAGEQQKIFDRFYQVEKEDNKSNIGTGIGLSLTREIVEMINGNIILESETGKGSEFQVIIPVTQKAPPPVNENIEYTNFKALPNPDTEMLSDEPELDHGNGKPLILLAEDNHDVAAYIRDIIRTKYKVKWVGDGNKAVQTALETIPDMVITDVMMPGKNGYEVCDILKSDIRTDHIPIIMLTAKVTDDDRISGYEKGADAYLTKPFNKKELLVRIEQLLKLRQQLQARFGNFKLKADKSQNKSPEEQFVSRAIQIVEKHIDESQFNASKLAEELNLSESQLYRKLKAISGKSTAIFIRTVRLTQAKALLDSTDQSVSEIAYQLGFNDPAWFSRVFKEEFGKAPSDTRKK